MLSGGAPRGLGRTALNWISDQGARFRGGSRPLSPRCTEEGKDRKPSPRLLVQSARRVLEVPFGKERRSRS